MLSSDRKYDKWKSITESDFVTLFIKTWFAYIAALREIYPNIDVFTADGMARGDKPFLNAFNDGMLSFVRRKIDIDEIAQNLFAFYPICMEKVMTVFPQYFFQTFFRYNEQFNYSDKSIIYHADGRIMERWQLSLKTESRYILRLYLGMSGNLYRMDYNEALKIEVDIKRIVNEVVAKCTEESVINELTFTKSIYDKMLEEISRKTSLYISDKVPAMGYNATIKSKIRSGCERMTSALRLLFDYNFKFPHDVIPIAIPTNSFAVIEQQPFPQFYQVYASGQHVKEKRFYDDLLLSKGLLWFSGFVYSLRNALFHEIIDPLDEEWQKIFKAAYLILKPITDICIDFLDSMDAIMNEEDTRILDYIENNTFPRIDVLSTHTTIEEVSSITIKEWSIVSGIIQIEGTVDVAIDLQFGSDSDIRREDGYTGSQVINCEYTAQLDKNFDLLGNPRDGYKFELSVIEGD